LSAHAVDALFGAAEVLAEGSLAGPGPGEATRWYGSVMITFDLDALRAACCDLDDEEALARLLHAVEGSVRVRARIHRLARAEVYRRFPDRTVGTAHIECAFRREGSGRLLMDIDVEAPIEQAPVRGGLP